MTRTALILLAACSLAAAPAPAQDVDELIARSIAARGGLERLKAIRSLRMTGKAATAGVVDMPMTVEPERPARLRNEFVYQGTPTVQAFDGHAAWGIAPGSRQPVLLPEEMQAGLAQQADLDGPLVDYKEKGHRAALVGQEKVEGRLAWKVRLTMKSGQVEHHFLDAKTLLPVKAASRRVVRGVPIEGETFLRDYREVAGVLFPHTIENRPDGRPESQTIRLTRVEVNPEIDPARFRTPAGAKPLPASRRP
jgi:hypothetical protein